MSAAGLLGQLARRGDLVSELAQASALQLVRFASLAEAQQFIDAGVYVRP